MACEAGTGRLVSALAESYAANDRCDEFTFKLRRNIRFSDGTAFNADVVRRTIDRAVRLQGDSSWLVTDFVRQVEALDERTVRFTLKEPTAFFPCAGRLGALLPGEPFGLPGGPHRRRPR